MCYPRLMCVIVLCPSLCVIPALLCCTARYKRRVSAQTRGTVTWVPSLSARPPLDSLPPNYARGIPGKYSSPKRVCGGFGAPPKIYLKVCRLDCSSGTVSPVVSFHSAAQQKRSRAHHPCRAPRHRIPPLPPFLPLPVLTLPLHPLPPLPLLPPIPRSIFLLLTFLALLAEAVVGPVSMQSPFCHTASRLTSRYSSCFLNNIFFYHICGKIFCLQNIYGFSPAHRCTFLNTVRKIDCFQQI